MHDMVSMCAFVTDLHTQSSTSSPSFAGASGFETVASVKLDNDTAAALVMVGIGKKPRAVR